MTDNIKILGTTWFSEMGSFTPIGVIHIHNGFEEKAYIGTGTGDNLDSDIQIIIKKGARFPLSAIPSLEMMPYATSTYTTPTI